MESVLNSLWKYAVVLGNPGGSMLSTCSIGVSHESFIGLDCLVLISRP
jgi:hypothetical protein